jgi:hypothetical protein
MTVSRRLAFAAAVLAVQFSLLTSAQASPIQAAELSTPTSALHVGFFLVEPHRLAPAAPLMVSAESSVSYGHMVSSTSFQGPDTTGALAAYLAGGTRLNEQLKPQAFTASNSATNVWPQGASHWQFEETSGDWRSRSGHWHDFEDGHHGRDDDGHEHPPAVPIPASLWLFASGLALLVPVIRAQRGHKTQRGHKIQSPVLCIAGEAA